MRKAVMTRVLLAAFGVLIGSRAGYAQTSAPSPQEQLRDAARAGDTLALGKALAAGARIDSL